ncbi:hypothetical protein B7494_g6684 [Chlorociboria aeruginascens]|nr:hypothetical protein B7494_g6684 [Chlorociboria aeruginascens]
MPAPKPEVPPAAQPNFGNHFDAWNSSSTGHQRAEGRLGGLIGWRQSRIAKLSCQFKSRGTGGERISDQVGAGSQDYDEKAKALIPKLVREKAETSIRHMLILTKPLNPQPRLSAAEKLTAQRKKEDDLKDEVKSRKRGIFDGLVIFINGSTHPVVSDHRLKQLLAENGARLSIHLGRKQVTHVILGRPCGTRGFGAGGGLAGGKLEKEIKMVGGCGVKYVDVEWVLASIKSGKRLSEAPFSTLKVARDAQHSVYTMFKKADRARSTEGG